jgi:hypothetical protein
VPTVEPECTKEKVASSMKSWTKEEVCFIKNVKLAMETVHGSHHLLLIEVILGNLLPKEWNSGHGGTSAFGALDDSVELQEVTFTALRKG